MMKVTQDAGIVLLVIGLLLYMCHAELPMVSPSRVASSVGARSQPRRFVALRLTLSRPRAQKLRCVGALRAGVRLISGTGSNTRCRCRAGTRRHRSDGTRAIATSYFRWRGWHRCAERVDASCPQSLVRIVVAVELVRK